MSKENFEENKIPGEILDDPDMLDEFMKMYAIRLTQRVQKQKMLQAELTKEELEIEFMKERVVILEKYKIFIESKGFHIAKQTIDAHADEIREAQKERVSEEEEDLCRMPCFVAGMQIQCMQYRGHLGACGLITS